LTPAEPRAFRDSRANGEFKSSANNLPAADEDQGRHNRYTSDCEEAYFFVREHPIPPTIAFSTQQEAFMPSSKSPAALRPLAIVVAVLTLATISLLLSAAQLGPPRVSGYGVEHPEQEVSSE
jgi:hypothetical protein